MASKSPKQLRSVVDIGQKQPRTKIYTAADGRLLFVSTEGMWAMHNAARECRAQGREATPTNLGTVLRCSASDVSRTIWTWRGWYRSYAWFVDWLFCAERFPPNVQVATLDMIRRCRTASDYIAHCREANVRAVNYYRWLKTGLIPNVAWFRWLYGAPPPQGFFVVRWPLVCFRQEGCEQRILKASGVSKHALDNWMKEPIRRDALAAAQRVASAGGDFKEFANSHETWSTLPVRTKKLMWKYAKAATLSARCARVGMSNHAYHHVSRDAELMGVKEELRQFLNCQEPYSDIRRHRSGLIAKNLFVPSPGMLAFREAARKRMVEQRIWRLQGLPAFFDWFQDWAFPMSWRGQRTTFSETSAQAGQPTKVVVTSPSPPEPNNVAASQVPLTPVKPFVPSPLQVRILAALENRALTADNLQDRLEIDRSSLYMRGLNELMARGKVVNYRRVGGYYRPDAPPPKYAKFLRENSNSQTEPPTIQTEMPTVI
jgi:hypothetical protein